MARRQPRHQSPQLAMSSLLPGRQASTPEIHSGNGISNSSGDRRGSMRASSSRRVRRVREDDCADWGALWSSAVREPVRKSSPDSNSPRSQIQALQARLLQQDARIAELKAQALHAKGTINSLKDSVETKKRWYKDDLALAKKYYEDDLARMKRYYDTDLATAERWHKSDLASARTFYNDSLQRDRQRALVDSERHYRTLNAFTNFVGQPPAEASTVEVPAPVTRQNSRHATRDHASTDVRATRGRIALVWLCGRLATHLQLPAEDAAGAPRRCCEPRISSHDEMAARQRGQADDTHCTHSSQWWQFGDCRGYLQFNRQRGVQAGAIPGAANQPVGAHRSVAPRDVPSANGEGIRAALVAGEDAQSVPMGVVR